jgi:hypothetical protein
MPSFEDESLPPVLAPVEPPCAPEDDEPPVEPEPPVTDELPSAPVPDDELPMAPDEVVFEPVLDEPVLDEPEVPDRDEPDEPPGPPLLPAALEPPVAPALPELLAPPVAPEPVDGLALEDELPLMLPDEPALADEPVLLLFRLLELSLPRLDWSLPMLLPLFCLLASTPFPSLDF